MKCKIDGCEKKVHAGGLCKSHDRRLKLYGNPLKVMQKQNHGMTTAQRFMQWFVKDEHTGCWNWTGGTIGKTGYGQFRIGSKNFVASRASWIIFKGEIPKNDSSYKTLFVCHKCDNPRCVNPDHLFLGDHQANVEDKMQKKRHRYGISVGESHGNSKLDEAKVRYIRSSSKTQQELASEFNMSQASIWAVIARKTWKHID